MEGTRGHPSFDHLFSLQGDEKALITLGEGKAYKQVVALLCHLLRKKLSADALECAVFIPVT